MSANASAHLAPHHRKSKTTTDGSVLWFLDWPQLSEKEWEAFAVACLEELCDAGAAPCPSGLVWRGQLIAPIAVAGKALAEAGTCPGVTDISEVYFAVFSEPDWELQTNTLCYTPKYGVELTPEEIDIVVGPEIGALVG